jgi:adenosylcobinamide kinase / adenosylcobinamide-phosphate guanylyltransferase
MSRTSATKRTSQRRPKGRLVFVLGGAASGKSEAALRLAGRKGPKAFVATGQGLDEEMSTRIARHQATRSSDWTTAEVPIELSRWFTRNGKRYRTIVVDCMTLWLSNLQRKRRAAAAIGKQVKELLQTVRTTSATVVIVSNELGLGLVPVEHSVRAFRDAAGRVNQQIAAEADEVHFVIGGMPLRLK